MESNVGGVDRIARLVLGAILALVGVAGFANAVSVGTAVAAVLLIVGVVLLGTGVTQQCLVYSLLDVDTCESK